MRETRPINALDEDLIISVLRHLDDHNFRATVACVCKTWRACVRRSWDRVHICFGDLETLRARLAWLDHQLQDHPLLLQSLEFHSCTSSPSLMKLALLVRFCVGMLYGGPDIASSGSWMWRMQGTACFPYE